jgi:hypothetical protein
VHLESSGEVMKTGRPHKSWRVTGGQLGQRYVIEQSIDGGVNWTGLQTNAVQLGDYQFAFPATEVQLYRVRVLED